MTNRSETGKLGENLACNYLIRNGYRIIERNYRLKLGEIDIIVMSPDKTLVFVEVKAMEQSGNAAMRQDDPAMLPLPDSKITELTPEDNLTRSKLLKLSRACSLFANKNPRLVKEEKGWRIDLVTVSFSQERKPEFRHYQNIM